MEWMEYIGFEEARVRGCGREIFDDSELDFRSSLLQVFIRRMHIPKCKLEGKLYRKKRQTMKQQSSEK